MGEEVTVLSSRETGRDAMGEPTVEWEATVVPGCLVRPLAGSDAGDAVRPEGIVASYSIAFPKTYAGPPLARCRIALTGRGIVYNVNRADCFYPNTSFNALERKRYLTLAIADCEQLMLDMQCLMDIGLPVNANRFEELAAMVEEEIRLLKGARKNVRVTGKKSTEERIAEAEAELERLRSL